MGSLSIQKALCLLGCVIALALGCSALAQAQTGTAASGKNKNTVHYYECKDLKGRISLQQEPCSGFGVKQTELNMDGSPGTAKPGEAAGATTAAGGAMQSVTAFADRYANIDAGKLKEKLQKAREESPFMLLVFFVLLMFAVWNSLVLIYLAFSQSVWWGLAYLFVPLGGLVYVFLYWHDADKPFLISLFSGLVAGIVATLYF